MLTIDLSFCKILTMKLKTFRTKNNLSVIALAKLLNISRQHVYDMESGDAYPSRRLAAVIEKKLNGDVTARELLGLK